MDLDEQDLAIVCRSLKLFRPPRGWERSDLEQEVCRRLLCQQLTTHKSGGLVWALARQKALHIFEELRAKKRSLTAEAIGAEPANSDTTDHEWHDTLSRLSWRHRTVLDLHYRLGLSLREVGSTMHVTASRAGQYMREARESYLRVISSSAG